MDTGEGDSNPQEKKRTNEKAEGGAIGTMKRKTNHPIGEPAIEQEIYVEEAEDGEECV